MRDGEIYYNVGLSLAEFQELIKLIDDDPVDEDFLRGIRKKLKHKERQLARRVAKRGA